MEKQIHTLQFSDRNMFDKQLNMLTEFGCKSIQNTYKVIERDNEVIYSIVVRINTFRICEINFFRSSNPINNELKLSSIEVKDLKTSLIDFIMSFLTIKKTNKFKSGTKYEFTEKGDLIKKFTYKNFRLDGPFIAYLSLSPNKEKIEGIYKRGNLIKEITSSKDYGIQVVYNYNGNNYKYWPNGIVEEKSFRKNGDLDGTWFKYFSNGVIEEKVKYKNNKRNGSFTKYWINGEKLSEGFYLEDKLDGYYYCYSEKGQLEEKRTFKDDLLVKFTQYNNDGEIVCKSKRNGPFVKYNEFGKKTQEGSFKNSRLDGLYTNYLDGRKWIKSTYKKGFLHGPYTSYYDDGVTKSYVGTYENGKKEGVFYDYNKDGELETETKYENGTKVEDDLPF